MTTERRLAKIEAALTPRELVIRWLDEAHAHADLTAYLSAMLAQDLDEMPFDRLVRETRENVGTRDDRALRRALGQTAFLYLLILRTAEITQTLLDKEVLVHGFLAVSLGMATFGQMPEPPDGFPRKREQFITLRDLAVDRGDEVQAMGIARAQVEERYFGGHPLLFPGTRTEWTEQSYRTQKLAVMTIRVGELDGIRWTEPADTSKIEARADALFADHVEPAQVKALGEMGEGRRASSIAFRWLEPTARSSGR